jgi:hypothetical protein
MLGNGSLYDQQALLLLCYVGPLHTITHSSGVVRDMDLADQQRDLGDDGRLSLPTDQSRQRVWRAIMTSCHGLSYKAPQ